MACIRRRVSGGGKNFSRERKWKVMSFLRGLTLLFAFVFLVAAHTAAAQTPEEWPRFAFSRDGTPISWEAHGKGEPALVFVHGWSCDARYWRKQVPLFSKRYRVITLDLAGHGHSGMDRKTYTMTSFGEDVRAVVEAAGARRVVLVGHSMGGSVIAEAARIMPEQVIGLIGVDTLENVGYRMSSEEAELMVAPFKRDFPSATKEFVSGMIRKESDPKLRQWIVSDMASAPPDVAVSAMEEMVSRYVTGEAAEVFEKIRIPVISINADLWPIDYEGNRRHMFFYDAFILESSDHFLMINRAEEFNAALEEALRIIMGKSAE